MPGMHGNYAAVAALQEADLLIALGARFDDRVTGNLATFAPQAKIIHVDIDPAEIGKNRAADVPIVGDAKLVIEELIGALEAGRDGRRAADTAAWQRATAQWKQRYPFRYDQPDGGPLKPQYVVERVSAPDRRRRDRRRRASASTRCGPRSTSASTGPGTWINSGGLGTMGFAVPAAMGAKVGRPGRAGGRDRRRRLLPDDLPGAGHLRHRADPDQGRHLQQRPTWAWSASGRSCSTTSATPRCTSASSARTT